MSILVNKVASLKSRSAKAIGVFQKTVTDLASANEEIDKADAVRVGKIDALQGERNELKEIRNQNQRFINKLNEFLGLD